MSYYSLFFIISTILFNASFCDYIGCQYRKEASQDSDTAPYTDDKYLTNSNQTVDKQKCFSLSHSDLVKEQCCYYLNKSKGYCIDQDKSGNPSDLICPEATEISNNCGMALFYQPLTTDICTEVSLVDGVCCYVKTNSKGAVCLKQDSVDEDTKFKISDYMKDYFRNKLKINPDEEIKSVSCEGYQFKFNIALLILLAVICL